jgi:hypothetical protein
MNEGLELFSAIVDTDTYDSEILFPGYISTGVSDVNIPPGTPLMTVFPFKRDSWESEVHKISQPAESPKFKKLNHSFAFLNIKIAFNKNGLPFLKKILMSCVIIFLFSHTKYIPSILSDLTIIFSNILGFKKIKVAVPVFPFLDFVNRMIGRLVSA